jgi:alpha-galactosidase
VSLTLKRQGIMPNPSSVTLDVYLRGGGASLLIELSSPRPRIVHWGEDLGPLSPKDRLSIRADAVPLVTHSSTDEPRHLTILPTEADAWSGTPGIEGSLRGGTSFVRFEIAGVEADEAAGTLTLDLLDPTTLVAARVAYQLNAHGLLAVTTTISLAAAGTTQPGPHAEYALSSLTTLLPLPERAVDLVDFTGKWSRERSPQRQRINQGTRLRESRRGRPSLDSPYLMMAGTAGFSFRSGEVWATHVGWSGNQRYLVEQLPEGAGVHRSVIGGGELLHAGEITVTSAAPYSAPTIYFAWSSTGMDGVASVFHSSLRARESHPTSPRPLTLNTWEAVYFDHDLTRLIELVETAADIGVERLVLDDGWFTGRRDDTTGLGDWFVDPEVWPTGLTPLVDRVRARGLQFGLWFEPEMVNLGSAIAAAHPDWILAPSRGTGPSIRNQFVLNLANPEAWAFVLDRLDTLVAEYSIDYIKWDHNRELHESSRRDAADAVGVHAQTEALYRLLDELRQRHPDLEIESCASGGGRVDLGILQRTDRVWASDCNDPEERQAIQRWTAQLIPLELIGSHVGAREAHTTHRTTALSFRLATALFGHAGLELDVTRVDQSELEQLAAWAALYKELRGLLHSGTVVRADVADHETLLTGVVAADTGEAIFSWSRLSTSPPQQSGRIRFPGLDPQRTYRLTVRTEIGASALQEQPPVWFDAALTTGIEVSGIELTRVGIVMPTLDPQQALLLHLVQTD